MLNLTWQSRLKTRRHGHGSLSGGESRKHWEEGAGGERKKRQHSMSRCGGPTWASCPPFVGQGRREGDRQVWHRRLELLSLGGKHGAEAGLPQLLRAPSVERRLTWGRQHAPGTPLCAVELRPTAAQRSLVQRSFVHTLSSFSNHYYSQQWATQSSPPNSNPSIGLRPEKWTH